MNELRDFSRKLEEARTRQGDDERPSNRTRSQHNAATGIAMRVGVEMLVAVCVAGFFGWAMDEWLGTQPWMLLAFIPLGIVAGIMNVVRAGKTINTQQDDS